MRDSIYVMSRKDGWHKIGISGHVSNRRVQVGAKERLLCIPLR